MASHGSATAASSLPLPPLQYYSAFSDEARQRGRPPPPPPLPPPPSDTYSMFGNAFCHTDPIIQPLERQGIRRLYPLNFDHRKELKKLNHSVLANFLDLIEILIRCPDSARRLDKLEDTKLLLIHMHHLINEFRPHQARETLRVTLELQKRKRLDVADRFQAHLDKVEETIGQALQQLRHSDVLENKLAVQLSCQDLAAADPLSDPQSCSSTSSSSTSGHDREQKLDALLCRIADEMVDTV